MFTGFWISDPLTASSHFCIGRYNTGNRCSHQSNRLKGFALYPFQQFLIYQHCIIIAELAITVYFNNYIGVNARSRELVTEPYFARCRQLFVEPFGRGLKW